MNYFPISILRCRTGGSWPPCEILLYCPLDRKADQLPRLHELEARVLVRALGAIREQEPVGTCV